MSELKALIFDVDGTLAETERDAHRVAFNKIFADYGLNWNWSVELYGELLAVTGGKERMKFYLEKYQPDGKYPTDIDTFIAEMHKKKTAYYSKLLTENPIPLRPGVRRLIEEARNQGLRLAIATTTSPSNVAALLENSLDAQSMSWFEVISAGDIVPAKKPAPDIYFHALENLGLTASECIAFEDSYNGTRSAINADLTTIVTTSIYTRNEDFAGAVLVLNHLGEPEQEFSITSGDAKTSTYVDVDLLRKLIAAK
ncbi:MAG: HAD family hydrolase [Thiomargarita sp.]|nr:HAD family hydrolase [Thiomargarita sp.]